MITKIIAEHLKPKTIAIDHGLYTTEVLEQLGSVGAFKHHIPSHNYGKLDMVSTIKDMASISEECMTTGFMMWAQTVCAWYIENSENQWLKETILPKMVEGKYFGATSLSNPMKYFAGIENLRLSAKETSEGYVINGSLPWVSNLEANSSKHFFGSIFTVQGEHDGDHKDVMALIPCDLEGMTMRQSVNFVGMEGSGTYAIVFDNALLPKKYLLADPLKPYLAKMKAGFIMLQAGMAAGVVQGAINHMHHTNLTLSEINAYLDDSPEELQEELSGAWDAIAALCDDIYNPSVDFMKSVLEVRLLAAEYCKRAADSVMQHAGAKGYIVDAIAQRKMREAYFVIIVTPSIKHLRKEIARLEAA
jgi:alkylation response protein AidB-like acyl-CoA dehydrogenase